jgi:aryl-alcohol dehydrogenase-like predicted oxidoreductase
MKVLCRGLGLRVPGCGEVSPWIRYALAHEVSTVVIGCDDPAHVERNAAAACAAPLTAQERGALEATVTPWARELMYYK